MSIKSWSGAVGLALTLTVLAACAEPSPEGAASGSSVAASPSETGRTPDGQYSTETSTIDWSSPIFGGIASSPQGADETGQLQFKPLYPDLEGGRITGVEVTDPATIPVGNRGLAVTYLFNIGADFPADGRLIIQERQEPKMTAADIVSIGMDPPGPAANFRLIYLGEGRLPALESNDGSGLGRLLFVWDGLRFDITGPSVSTKKVDEVGLALYTLAGGK